MDSDVTEVGGRLNVGNIANETTLQKQNSPLHCNLSGMLKEKMRRRPEKSKRKGLAWRERMDIDWGGSGAWCNWKAAAIWGRGGAKGRE